LRRPRPISLLPTRAQSPLLLLLGALAGPALAPPRAWAAPAAAPAPAPAAPPAGAPTAVAPATPAEGVAPAVPPPAAPAPAAAQATLPAAGGGLLDRAPIVSFDITGTLTDPRERVEAFLRGVVPEGTAFLASGPADRVGAPLGTVPRLRRALDVLGYDAAVTAAPAAGGGVTVRVALRPYDRVRYIFVSGNGTIRQDEIQRRISIRTGHPLPLAGRERDAAIERERERVIRFLRDEEGYFEANVRIDLVSNGGPPAAVDLFVRITRGPGYPIGPISISGNTVIPSDQIEKRFRHLDRGKERAPHKITGQHKQTTDQPSHWHRTFMGGPDQATG